ncbi:MAG: phosphoribosylanthranilate isomerase [Xanthomonadaceae bacterium]|nr:phosphoribosylanthranilate isomerase [Xanthomonadaceae bacterium]
MSDSALRRTRIKFCGFTRASDIDEAVALGVDAIGLILVPQSPRAVSLERAAALKRSIPPLVSSVVLLRNPDADLVHAVLATIRPSLLQFHGEESASFCASFGHPYLKAIAMQQQRRTLAEIAADYPSAAALLLDGHAPGGLGGQGHAFDWAQATGSVALPVVLAGGIRPDNVAAAIQAARPYAVDVSSGIEQAPGHKDSGKMRDFAREVRRADQIS